MNLAWWHVRFKFFYDQKGDILVFLLEIDYFQLWVFNNSDLRIYAAELVKELAKLNTFEEKN